MSRFSQRAKNAPTFFYDPGLIRRAPLKLIPSRSGREKGRLPPLYHSPHRVVLVFPRVPWRMAYPANAGQATRHDTRGPARARFFSRTSRRPSAPRRDSLREPRRDSPQTHRLQNVRAVCGVRPPPPRPECPEGHAVEAYASYSRFCIPLVHPYTPQGAAAVYKIGIPTLYTPPASDQPPART